jgi:hypothetical protein
LGSLTLKPADTSRPYQWSDDDYYVLENGVVAGRIFLSAAPRNRSWMWASGHNGEIVPRGNAALFPRGLNYAPNLLNGMRPSNPPRNVASFKNAESVVTAPQLRAWGFERVGGSQSGVLDQRRHHADRTDEFDNIDSSLSSIRPVARSSSMVSALPKGSSLCLPCYTDPGKVPISCST